MPGALQRAVRANEILAVLARHGFAEAFGRLGLTPRRWAGSAAAPARSTGERLRLAAEELGPAFVKLGQLLSARPDIVPHEILLELRRLQDHVRPLPFAELRPVLAAGLGRDPGEVFAELDEQSAAAASLAQVHFGRLVSGEAVAVKVRVTEEDPLEKGKRRLLNLGHTLGHALEAQTRHALPHGMAVAYGLLYAALLGRALGGEDLLPPVRRLLLWLSPPPLPPLAFEDLLPYLLRDKKKVSESLHWVVPLAPGRLVVRPLPEGLLREAFAAWREELKGLGLLR